MSTEAETPKYDEQSATSLTEHLKGYVAKPEVAELYRAITKRAKVINVASKTVDILTKHLVLKAFPSIHGKLIKLTSFATLLGQAGASLGTTVDVLSAFGLLQDDTTTLDELSQQIQPLRDHVTKGFQDVKAKLDITLALTQFLPVFNKLRAQVQIYEQNVAGIDIEADKLYKRLDDMVEDSPPGAIILDLKQLHNLITGNAQFGKPLFQQLAEGVTEFEGDAFDEFLVNLFIQFQLVIALEIRAVRMLRSLLVVSGKDLRYGNDVKAIFKDLSVQRSEYDPVAMFEWYVDFRSSGGKFKIKALKPDCSLYMATGGGGQIRGWESDPGPKGMFSITPCDPADGGTFLVSTKAYSDYFMQLKTNENDAYVNSTKDIGNRCCHWYFHIKDIENKVFMLSTAQCMAKSICVHTAIYKPRR